MEPFVMLVIVLFIVIILVLMTILIIKNTKKNRLQLQMHLSYINRQENAIRGKATIVHSKGVVLGDDTTQARVSLVLEVTPSGGIPYRAATQWLAEISALGALQEGLELSVKIDAEDPMIIYPNEPWATYLPE